MKFFLILALMVFSVVTTAADKHLECDSADTITAQAAELLKVAEKLDECPPPKDTDYRLLCGDVVIKSKVPKEDTQYYEYVYEKRLWQMSCADPKKDNEQKAKEKITKMWAKNHKNFKCDSVAFNVPNGNILKYSISNSLPDFIETLVLNYDLDINFVDPADNRNVLDYVNDQVEKLKKNGASRSSVEVYEKYREALISLGAKYSKP